MVVYFKAAFGVCLLLCVAASCLTQASAQQTAIRDEKLIDTLQDVLSGFRGDVGLYAYHLKSRRVAAINADTIFPTASTIKVPIFCGLCEKIDRGELSYRRPLVYQTARAVKGSGIMKYFQDSTKVSVSTLATLMIIFSDNSASFWCQELAGGGAQINKWLARNGFKDTRVNSRTEGRQEDYRRYGWGQTTPREMATLMLDICKNKVLTPAACDRMYRTLSQQTHDRRSLSEIPPYIQTADKTGGVNASRSEVVFVSAPHGDYVFAVYTKNNADHTWRRNNEAQELIRQVSAVLWHHFEPDSRWRPPVGNEKFRY